jgi:hypothetical protein
MGVVLGGAFGDGFGGFGVGVAAGAATFPDSGTPFTGDGAATLSDFGTLLYHWIASRSR